MVVELDPYTAADVDDHVDDALGGTMVDVRIEMDVAVDGQSLVVVPAIYSPSFPSYPPPPAFGGYHTYHYYCYCHDYHLLNNFCF